MSKSMVEFFIEAKGYNKKIAQLADSCGNVLCEMPFDTLPMKDETIYFNNSSYLVVQIRHIIFTNKPQEYMIYVIKL